jgi:hypothetical protein
LIETIPIIRLKVHNLMPLKAGDKMKTVAIVIAVVLLTTVVVYPLIFGTDPQPADAPPVELELGK